MNRAQKNPNEAIRFAMAFEERTTQQKRYKGINIKTEPVPAVTNGRRNQSTRCVIEFEQKYSINELEVLAVELTVNNFRNYVYGKSNSK